MNTGKTNNSQMRITEDEIALIKSTFLGNEALLKLMRKMFLPELDPSAPLGQMVDLYRTIPTKDRTDRDIAVDLTSRNIIIDHIENVLLQLSLIAKTAEETPEQTATRLKKNSSK